MNRKSQKIYINKEPVDVKIIGILSQVLPHELMLALASLWQVDFKKFTSEKIEGFQTTDEHIRLFIISNKIFPEVHVDYLLVVVGAASFNKQLNELEELKKNAMVLGFYEINLTRRQLIFLLQQLSL